MENKSDPTQLSLKWFEIWRIAFFHPTIKAFSRIINDPKASFKWGVIWMAVISFIAWFDGPLVNILSGWTSQMFGFRDFYSILYTGALASPIFGVIALIIIAAIAHGFARLFNGTGTFHQLVYCWAVMQLPFILLAGLVMRIPSILSLSLEFNLSKIGLIMQFVFMLAGLCIYLYLFYAQVVAFSTVENFGIGKGFGFFFLLAIVVGITGVCLSFAFQSVMMKFLRY